MNSFFREYNSTKNNHKPAKGSLSYSQLFVTSLHRLPITLTQLKAESNSEKRKNEIRQLFILCTDEKTSKKYL